MIFIIAAAYISSFKFIFGLLGILKFVSIDPLIELESTICLSILPYSLVAYLYQFIVRKYINSIQILGWTLILFPVIFAIEIWSNYSYDYRIGSLTLIPIGMLVLFLYNNKKKKKESELNNSATDDTINI